jgi:hypothetical protein
MKSLKIKIKDKIYFINEFLFNLKGNKKIFLFEDKDLKKFLVQNNKRKYILREKLNESGAGYAVWGGTRGGYGNPSNGFGQASTSGGGPNVMYTYAVKPLNHTLEQPSTPQGNNKSIHLGTNISGTTILPEKREELEGQVLSIKKDHAGDILYYVIIDETGRKRKIDPTSAEIIDYNVTNNKFIRRDLVGESFYPRMNDK